MQNNKDDPRKITPLPVGAIIARGRKENRMENAKMLTDEELAKELAKMTPAERAQAMAYVMGLVAGKAQAKATEPAGGAA